MEKQPLLKKSDTQTFTKEQIMSSSLWCDCVKNIDKLESGGRRYTLHACRDYTIGRGRLYVALPANEVMTPDFARMHNVMPY